MHDAISRAYRRRVVAELASAAGGGRVEFEVTVESEVIAGDGCVSLSAGAGDGAGAAVAGTAAGLAGVFAAAR